MRVVGREHIPEPDNDGFIVASNHISYLDPPTVGSCFPYEIHYMAKRELFSFRPFGAVLRNVNAIPVRRGAVDRDSLKQCLAVLQRGGALIVFPEGTRSKTAAMLPPRPGIGLLAARARCAVLPTHVSGLNRYRSCLLGRVRPEVRFGPLMPAGWTDAFPRSGDGYRQAAEQIMDRIRRLRAETVGAD